MLKINRNTSYIFGLFVAISLIFWAIRLYRLETLMAFSFDQAMFLTDVSSMLEQKKIRLIGDFVQTKTINGRGFYSGPGFYYVLAPLALLSNWDIYSLTVWFMVLWWLSGLLIFYWLGKTKDWYSALSAYLVYSLVPFYLTFSRFLWNPNILPLLSVLFFYLLSSTWHKFSSKTWLAIGFVAGFGFSCHFSAILWIGLAGLFCLWGLWRKNWPAFTLIFLALGFIIGNLPFFVFEIRHNFYNLSTMWLYFTHSKAQTTSALSGSYHYLFPLAGLLFYLWGSFVHHLLVSKHAKLGLFLTLGLVFFMLFQIDWRQKWSIGMAPGWTITKQNLVTDYICHQNHSHDFEIATTLSGDTLSTDLRWLLQKAGCPPLGYDQYPHAKTLYLVAPQDRPPETELVWEVRSMRPFEVVEKVDLKDGIWLYKLVK